MAPSCPFQFMQYLLRDKCQVSGASKSFPRASSGRFACRKGIATDNNAGKLRARYAPWPTMRKKQGQHFSDIFEVLEKDPDGKRFDKVSRIRAHSDMYEMDLLLDINSDLYPIQVNEKFSLALSTTLHRNNDDFPEYYDKDLATKHGKGTLLDDYDYVMHGKVFKFKDNHATGQLKVEVYVSYGGLLMQITGSPKELESLEVDSNVFLLMRKV